MSLTDDVRAALYVTSTLTDVEIEGHVAAALADMRRVGVRGSVLTEPMNALAKAAVVMYCKANYGFDNSESEMYWQRYLWTVTSLMNSSMNECDESVDESPVASPSTTGDESDAPDGGVDDEP